MKSPSGPGRRPDLSRALEQYRSRAGRYDAELVPYEPLRVVAIEQLELQAGQVVLDVGCGTGLSFEALVRGVGPKGRVIGVEPCPEMLAQARARAERHGWTNVDLVQSGAAQAHVKGPVDALLFHFTHDVMRDPVALANLLAQLRPGAHVVASGLRLSAAPWLWPTNGLVLLAALYSVTSMEGLAAPWDRLGPLVDGLRVDSPMPGFYVATGRARKHRAAAASR